MKTADDVIWEYTKYIDEVFAKQESIFFSVMPVVVINTLFCVGVARCKHIIKLWSVPSSSVFCV